MTGKPRVLIAFNVINGYSSACWRALASTQEIELKISAFEASPDENVRFESNALSQGLDLDVLPLEHRERPDAFVQLLSEYRPDFVFVSGWAYKAFRGLYRILLNTKTPYGIYSDNPFRGTLRQKLGQYALGSILSHATFFVVPGERGFQLAKSWGVPEVRIRRNLYGVDFAGLNRCYQTRRESKWPGRFLFVGRYHRIKGMDLLLEAYRRYRATVNDPWELHCCGMGPLTCRGETGVVDHGFLQPAQVEKLRGQAGVGVLPSRSDPWPLALVENCAAGLPMLCTVACGSSVELVRDMYNGRVVATDDVSSLVNGMTWFHDRLSALPELGRRSNCLAEAYSAEAWAQAHLEMIRTATASEFVSAG